MFYENYLKKITIQTFKIIKNKTLQNKIIFKKYLKIQKIGKKKIILSFKTDFCFIKPHKIVFKNYSQKLFFTIIF